MPELGTPDAMIFLYPGEIVTTADPVSVKTILGSCVAITMRSPRAGFAAMAHCLLPSSGWSRIPDHEATRYVDATIDMLLRFFSERVLPCGISRSSSSVERTEFPGAATVSGSATWRRLSELSRSMVWVLQ